MKAVTRVPVRRRLAGGAGWAAKSWDGLRLLELHFTPSELAELMCDSIASRLKNDQGTDIARVIERLRRLGAMRIKAVLTRPLLLRVLPEFIEYMSTIDDDALWFEIETPRKRKYLLDKLEAAEGFFF